ncbi:hypothetical protein ACEPAI_3577 [Sanghuangporus weigelae]
MPKAESTIVSPIGSASGSDMDIESSHATPITALDSSSSSSSPPLLSSSSTDALSYSVTQKEDQQTSTTDDVPRRNARRERQPATSRFGARSPRPFDLKHLEYRDNLSTKVPDEWMQHDDQTEYERGYKKPEAENGRETRRLRARIVHLTHLSRVSHVASAGLPK